MRIRLYEPPLLAKGGFFSFVYHALITRRGAVLTEAPRPLPPLTQPREHLGAWLEVDEKRVFIDMSDHVFLFDLDALRLCDLYFKTNLNRESLHSVLAANHTEALATKIRPFFSFAGYLEEFLHPSLPRRLYDRCFGCRLDLCHVVGVYEHLRRDGETSVYHPDGPEISSSRAHYWARVHTQEALRAAGLTGTCRLTSRCNPSLEDHTLIFPNLSQRAYRRAILRSKFPVINTLPHALLPWKATEALALGRPFIVDVPPLTEFPEPFQLRESEHYLSLLPPQPFDSPIEGRVLHRYTSDDFQAGAERIAAILRDPDQLARMNRAASAFRDTALNPETVAAYLCDTVEALS
ncbi:MAG: hypothetical protein LAT79_04540 [Kiritimatiellae bacterium]|nr:hypothetical protein [Kiritimatiellia bacterium]